MPQRYIVNVEVVVCRGDQYLTVVRSEREAHAPGALSFPGGKIEDAGVTANILEATARREALEEVGVELGDDIVYLESKSFIADDDDPVVDIVFLARYASGDPVPGDPDEVASLEWLTADDVATHPNSAVWAVDSIKIAERRRLELGWN